MARLEDMITELRVNELLKKNKAKSNKKVVLWVLAGIGLAVALAAAAYGAYRFFMRGELAEFDDDFEEDYDSYFADEAEECLESAEEFAGEVKKDAEKAVEKAADKVKDVVEDTVG